MSKAVDVPAGPGVHDPVFRSIPHLFDPPEDWTLSTSWQRAQEETDHGGPVNDAERVVLLDGSDDGHRVLWGLKGATLRCKCSCKGFQFRDWCAHVASLWWRWSRGRLDTVHLDTGRQYREPPSWLRIGESADVDLDELTVCQLDAWLHCERGGVGVRKYARRTNRAPGTVGNHLRWAREKVGGER